MYRAQDEVYLGGAKVAEDSGGLQADRRKPEAPWKVVYGCGATLQPRKGACMVVADDAEVALMAFEGLVKRRGGVDWGC